MTENIVLGITEADIAAAASSNYTPVPAGSYNAVVFEVKQETVKAGPNEGKPRFNVQFKIEGGPHDNRRVFGYVSLYKSGDFWKTQSFFSALGFDMKAGQFTVPTPQELMGLPIGIRVKVGKDQNGADRNEISGFDKPTAQKNVATATATPVANAADIWA